MDYVSQEKKTLFSDPDSGERYRLIIGQNCVAEAAFREFMATKTQYGKDCGVFYKQFVQSFKPGEVSDPREIHRMGLELAEYFKGFEVLVATHIDADHRHNHLIVNSVNLETGLKIQFNEKSLSELRQFSDKICQAHGLQTLKPYEKTSQTSGVNTREYRAALKGGSWKFRLMSLIDSAMQTSRSKAEFIRNMERLGYSVKWEHRYKYITYTTPEGQRCRDNRLHDEKYLKERMEIHYELRQAESPQHAGEPNRGVQPESAVLRNPAESFERPAAHVVGNRKISNSDIRADSQTPDMEKLGERDSAEARERDGRTYGSGQRTQSVTRSQSAARDEFGESGDYDNSGAEIDAAREFASGPRRLGREDSAEVARNRGLDSSDILGIAVALENLVAQPQREAEQEHHKHQQAIRARKRKQSQRQRNDQEMSM
jgi:hypothetical protein